MSWRGEELAERTLWLREDAWMSRDCSVEEMVFWGENLEKATRVRRR